MAATLFSEQETALVEISKQRLESYNKLRDYITALLQSKAKISALLVTYSVHLSEIDAEAAAAPDDLAKQTLAATKKIKLAELAELQNMLEQGEALLRADASWSALLDKLQG